MSEIDERCRWNGEERVTVRHLRDCIASGCEGCQPCEQTHCTMPRCSRHSRDLRCAKCVGVVRESLGRIGDLCRLTTAAAIEGGMNSAAADLAGPVADHATHQARWHWVVRPAGGMCRCLDCPDLSLEPIPHGPACRKCNHHTCRRIRYEPLCPGLVAWLDNADDELHPLWVLGTWDMLIAEHLAHHRTAKVTIPGAVRYLDANLTDLARDPEFPFDELAREVEECMTHVEQVLLVAPHVQRGAPCPTCRAAGRKAKPLEREYRPGSTDTRDEWTCPTKDCKTNGARTKFDLDTYGKKVYLDYLANADRLTAAQITAQYRVPASTVRRWANGWTDGSGLFREPTVRKRGKNADRQQLYDVADVKANRDTTSADCA